MRKLIGRRHASPIAVLAWASAAALVVALALAPGASAAGGVIAVGANPVAPLVNGEQVVYLDAGSDRGVLRTASPGQVARELATAWPVDGRCARNCAVHIDASASYLAIAAGEERWGRCVKAVCERIDAPFALRAGPLGGPHAMLERCDRVNSWSDAGPVVDGSLLACVSRCEQPRHIVVRDLARGGRPRV